MTGTVKARVKPLEWRNFEATITGYERYEADTIVGAYCISIQPVGFVASRPKSQKPIGTFPALEAAKAAAQADYERRILAALTASASEPQTGRWSYSINYGPDGEENWANLITPQGDHVANIRTHHAQAIVAGLNASPVPANGQVPVSTERTYYTEGKDCQFYEALSDKDFAWEATKMAQDLVDMDTLGLEEILPFVGVLSIAAARIERLASPVPASEPGPVAWRYLGEFNGKKLPWNLVDDEWIAKRRAGDGGDVEPLYAKPVPTPDESWKKAFAAQSRKLEAVLHIPGVKEALAELKWPDPLVPTPDGAVEASVETVAAMLLGSVNAPEQAIYRVARQIVGALSHPADGWREPFDNLSHIVQYCRTDGSQRWTNMAAFDSETIAEKYRDGCAKDHTVWEYRVVPAPAAKPEGE